MGKNVAKFTQSEFGITFKKANIYCFIIRAILNNQPYSPSKAIIVPFANCDYMERHLALTSTATFFGRYTVIMMDCAGASNKDGRRFYNLR